MYDHDIQMKVAKIIEQISDVHGKQTDIYSALFLFDDLLKHMPLVETYTSDTLKAMKLAYAGLNHAYQKITKRSFDNELEIFIQETISSVQKIYNKLILDRISLEHAFNQKYPEFQHLDIRDPKILKYLNDLIQDKKNDVLYAEKRAEEEQTFEQIRYYFQVEIEMLLLMEEMSEILMKVRWMDHHHMLEYIKEFQEKLND